MASKKPKLSPDARRQYSLFVEPGLTERIVALATPKQQRTKSKNVREAT